MIWKRYGFFNSFSSTKQSYVYTMDFWWIDVFCIRLWNRQANNTVDVSSTNISILQDLRKVLLTFVNIPIKKCRSHISTIISWKRIHNCCILDKYSWSTCAWVLKFLGNRNQLKKQLKLDVDVIFTLTLENYILIIYISHHENLFFLLQL